MMELELPELEMELEQEGVDEEEDELLGVPRAPGPQYQQQLSANRFLPYNFLLEEESSWWLSEILEGLAKSVLTGDYRPGLLNWSVRLQQYLSHFGRKFVKEQHLQLIHLYFTLIVDKKMEPSLVSRLAGVLRDLLRMSKLLTPKDLQLDWQELYQVYERLVYATDTSVGLLCVPLHLDKSLENLIICCRPYFTPHATQEMLAIWRPLFCPHSTSIKKAMKYCALFLPTLIPADSKDMPWKLWFEELLGIWLTFPGSPPWDDDLVNLLSRLAFDNIGQIDWSPYISVIFNKLLRYLHLPVGKKQLKRAASALMFDIHHWPRWIISMLHLDACLYHFDAFCTAVESYFYPSNHGEWSIMLSMTVLRLPMILTTRLNCERYRRPTWVATYPSSGHLTDEQVLRFVKAIKPLVLLNMYSKNPVARIGGPLALKHLAEMAPEQIVPELLERLYPSLESVTEPHRLTATMSSMTICLSSLFEIPEGRKHVLPLMVAVLPGIDSNDPVKSACTFQFLASLLSMVPLVDCSSLTDHDDLTAEEKDLCVETAGFEDFALMCIERCLVFISNSTNDLHNQHHEAASCEVTEKATQDEKYSRMGLIALIATVFYQSSESICRAVLQKLFSFVSGRIFIYNHYTATALANICSIAVRLRPHIAKEELLDPLMALFKVRVNLRARDIASDESIDEEIAWTLKLVADVLASSARATLSHRGTLQACFPILLSAKCLSLYKLTVHICRAMLRGLVTIFPTNIASVVPTELGFTEPSQVVMVRHWRQLINHNDVQMQWHVPDQEEMDFADELLKDLLLPALKKLKAHSDEVVMVERKDLEKTLLLVEAIVTGAAPRLPFDSDVEYQVATCSSAVHMYSTRPDPIVAPDERWLCIDVADRATARRTVFEHVQPVLAKISAADEDDVKSIKIILRILRTLMFYRGVEADELQGRIRSQLASRKRMSRSLGWQKDEMRLCLFERVFVQHEKRLYDHRGSPLTTLRRDILKELIHLSTGQYRDIRVLGQNYFNDAMKNIRFAYRPFVDEIVELLHSSKDLKSKAHQMKGCLYLIVGGKSGSLILKHDWHTLSKTLPCLVRIGSDSKTVPRVLDRLVEKWERGFCTRTVQIDRAESAMTWAHVILQTQYKDESSLNLTEIWQQRIVESGKNEQNYLQLVKDILEFIRERVTKPKAFHFALFLLGFLVRRDVALPASLLDTFMDNWANPHSEKARKLCQQPILICLRYLKPATLRTDVDLRQIAGLNPANNPIVSGIREDNLWLCFDEEKLPQTEEEYEGTVFVDKVEHGFYGWPTKLSLPAPIADQPRWEKMPECLNAMEKVIYGKMTDESFVDTLVRLSTVEGSKLHSKFDSANYEIFRGFFRHFHVAFLPTLLPHVEKMVSSKDEYQHRLAAEILAGVIGGAKRWPYQHIAKLWAQLTPIIKTALASLTLDSLADWGEFSRLAFGQGDSRRHFPLLNLLFDLPKADTTFQTSSRLFVLHKTFSPNHDWRRKQLHVRVVDMMRERIEEPYRDRIAGLLASVFRSNIPLPNLNKTIEQGPRISVLIQQVLPQCQELIKGTTTNKEPPECAMKILKTMAKVLSHFILCQHVYAPLELQWLLPYLFRFESDSRDEELRNDCIGSLACLSQLPLTIAECEEMFKQLDKVLSEKNNSCVPWRDRVLALEHLQAVVFNNLFILKNQVALSKQTKTLVLSSLENESVEVRQVAGITLAGLTQCGFILMNHQMLDQFLHLSELKFSGSQRNKRHAGVLGLCSYLLAYPYTIAKHTPHVLIVLSGHVNDPQPICQTVKNTIKEFRRTHLDNWNEHKGKFTDDQLITLTDLLVSPTYYA